MRITDSMRFEQMLRSNQTTSQRVSDASEHASAGRTVLAPSDDPVAYATTVRREAALQQMTSRGAAARSAADDLTVAEGALSTATTIMQQAQSLAVQGANETLSQNDRNSLAQEVQGMRQQLLDLANTKGSSGYVFGGTQTGAPPFDAAGAFTGNDNVVTIPVGGGAAPKGNVSGARAFTSAGGRDVFADLDALATALQTGDVASVRSSIDVMSADQSQVNAAQVDSGLSIERLTSAADVLDQAKVNITASISTETGADDAAALITTFTAASTAYQQSLEVTRQLLALPTLASSS